MDQGPGGQPQDPNRRIETPYTQVPPLPPQQGGRSWIKWLLIGGGGCLMLVVLTAILFGGCLAVLSSGGDSGSGDGNDGGGGNSEGLGYKEALENAVPVGETVKVGDVAWTVSNVQNSSQLKALGEKKQGNFVIVDVTFINNGKEPVTLDSASLALRDDQDRTHETDPDASFYVPTNQDLFLNQVNPGVSKQGRAIFTVAPDAKGLILEAGDTDMFGGDSAYVNLGI